MLCYSILEHDNSAKTAFNRMMSTMLRSSITIKEVLNANEVVAYQIKEVRKRFDSGDAARICCAVANRYSVSQINVPAKW